MDDMGALQATWPGSLEAAMTKGALDLLRWMRISSDLRTVAFHEARHPLAVYLAEVWLHQRHRGVGQSADSLSAILFGQRTWE